MNELIDIKNENQKQIVIQSMPKKYSEFKKLSSFSGDVFIQEKLIEIKLNKKIYVGKCFVNMDKREMYWRPQHRWYVFINELKDCYSYDLLQDKEIRFIPTDIQLNTYFEKKLKEILLRGKHHLEETKKAYIDLQKLKVEI
jgi:hypothetical protein